jgi:glycosyltransferase involved in cell wall biosynthesis
MIRVCMITTDHSFLDTRIFYKEALSLKNAGYDVWVIGKSGSEERKNIQEIEIIGLKKGRGLLANPILWMVLAKEASKVDAAIYHCHEPESFLVALYLRFFKGKTIIYDIHEFYLDIMRVARKPLKIFLAFMLFLVEPLFCKYACAIITADEGISRRYARFNNNVVSIFNFPISGIFDRNDLQSQGERYNGRFTVVYVGGMNKDRGILECIKAVHQASIYHPDIKLQLIGGFKSPEFENACLEYIDRHQLHDKVELLGPIPHHNVPKYIAASDIGIALYHPTKRLIKTSYPIKLFEYMICGKPVIVSDLPGMKKVVEEARCGLLVNPMDIESVSRALIYAVEHPEELSAMGRRGKEAVNTRYNWESMEKVLLEVYQKICVNKTPI